VPELNSKPKPKAKPPAIKENIVIELPPRAADAPAPLPKRGDDVADGEAVAADDTPPVVKPRYSFRRTAPVIAVALGLVASTLSVAGMIAASRTMSKAVLLIEDAQAREARLARLDHLAAELAALTNREQIALARIEQINAGRPATPRDVQASVGALQMSIARYNPGINGSLTALGNAQVELADRISILMTKVERIEAATASRKATPAAGRAPPS
jgi:hypothetical protein